jgi:hypothetical protein
MNILTTLRHLLSALKSTRHENLPSKALASEAGTPNLFDKVEAMPLKESRPTYVYDVFIRDELKYQFMESIWYDTASPAQGCISRLREIKTELPYVVIHGFGKEYRIETLEELKLWVRDVFSPTGSGYECDFSEYL